MTETLVETTLISAPVTGSIDVVDVEIPVIIPGGNGESSK